MKKLAKVLFVLILALAVVPFAAANAKGDTASDEAVVLDILAYGDNSNAEGIRFKRIVDDFMAANPNVDVQFEMLFDEAYFQKAGARIASGDIPDVYYGGADARWGTAWAEAGQQVDHRPFMDDTYYDLSLIPDHGPNGEVYTIPLGTTNLCTVMFANEALINELGFDLPETYEDLVAMVPAAQAAGLDVVSFDGADGWAWGSCFLSAMVARYTGDAMFIPKAVAGEESFTNPGFVKALEAVQMWVEDGVFSESVVLVDYGTNLSNYSNGQSLFVIQGQWVAGDIEESIAENTVIMSIPAMPGEVASMAGSCAGAMSVGYGLTAAGAEDPAVRDAGMAFIQYFNSHAETAQRLIEGAIVAPILVGMEIPAEVPAINVKKIEYAQSGIPTTAVIDAFLSGPANDAINTGAQRIASGQATPQEVAEEVERLARQ